MELMDIPAAVEALLFSAGDSVSIKRLASVLGCEPWEVRKASEHLAREYEEKERGLRLLRLDEKLQLVSAPMYNDAINRLLEKRPKPKLSQAALEVLAITAYYQPVTRSYIEKIRGADSSYTIALLTDRGLIAPSGHLDAPGRPLLYRTTEHFLRIFGISSIEELPPLPDVSSGTGMQELEEAINAASEEREQLKIFEGN